MEGTRKPLDSFSVISTVACTVIGVGIFYKNSTVFSVSENSWTTVLFAWLFVAFICVCTSISYSRISLLNPTDLGFCGWAESIVNKGFSNLVSQIFILFKMGICIPAYCFYGAATLLKVLQPGDKKGSLLNDGLGAYSSFGLIIGIGLCILVFFVLINYYRPDLGISMQKTFFRLKFVPIVMAVVFGAVIACINRSGGLFTGSGSKGGAAQQTKGFSFVNAVAATPGIMMAFDAFLNPGFYSTRLENPKKQLPRIYLVSIAIFTSVYLIITVNQLLSGTGDVVDIFSEQVLGGRGSRAAKFIFLLFVFISAIGLVNGYSNTMMPTLVQALDDDVFCMSKYLCRKYGDKNKAAFRFWVYLTAFWTVLMVVFCAATNSGAALDRLTDIPALFMFSVYGLLSLIYFCNKSREVSWKDRLSGDRREITLLAFVSIVAFLGWIGIVLFQVAYNCVYLPSSRPSENSALSTIWCDNKLNNWQAACITAFCVLGMFGFYFVDKICRNRVMAKN